MTHLNQTEVRLLREGGFTEEQIILFNEQAILEATRERQFRKLSYGITWAVTRTLNSIVSPRNRHFVKRSGFHFGTFMKGLVTPMEDIALVLKQAEDNRFTRRCQLPMKFRVFRALCLLRKEKPVSLTQLTGQSPATVSKDVELIIRTIADHMGPSWIRMPRHTEPEYDCLRGGGDFSDMDNVVYSSDLTAIVIARPSKGETGYYSQAKKRHLVWFMTNVDGFGQTRYWGGDLPGRWTEPAFMSLSGFYRKIPPCVLSLFIVYMILVLIHI